MHLLYAIASWIALAALLPVLLTHPKLRHGIPFRFGLYRPSFDAGRGSPRIWLHGASAGDLLSLQPMMRELKARVPGCCIVVTTITNSGLAMARKKLAEADVVLYAPYDLPRATRRAGEQLRVAVVEIVVTRSAAAGDGAGPARGHRADRREGARGVPGGRHDQAPL